jgi:hypothetical protein
MLRYMVGRDMGSIGGLYLWGGAVQRNRKEIRITSYDLCSLVLLSLPVARVGCSDLCMVCPSDILQLL